MYISAKYIYFYVHTHTIHVLYINAYICWCMVEVGVKLILGLYYLDYY